LQQRTSREDVTCCKGFTRDDFTRCKGFTKEVFTRCKGVTTKGTMMRVVFFSLVLALILVADATKGPDSGAPEKGPDGDPDKGLDGGAPEKGPDGDPDKGLDSGAPEKGTENDESMEDAGKGPDNGAPKKGLDSGGPEKGPDSGGPERGDADLGETMLSIDEVKDVLRPVSPVKPAADAPSKRGEDACAGTTRLGKGTPKTRKGYRFADACTLEECCTFCNGVRKSEGDKWNGLQYEAEGNQSDCGMCFCFEDMGDEFDKLPWYQLYKYN